MTIGNQDRNEMNKGKSTAIILSAGFGKRMNSDVPKQYMLLNEKPILYYTIKAFEDSAIDEIILVTGAGDEDFCKTEIVKKYNFKKVVKVVAGGKERYHSVHNGLQAINTNDCAFVFIHDGARPFVSQEVIANAMKEVKEYEACIVGVAVKDTIKIVDENGYVTETPRRDMLYQVQTPQVFSCELIKHAYELLIEKEDELIAQGIKITDDAMVVETLLNKKVKVITGSYNNIKITTPEDLVYAQSLIL